MSLIDHRKTFWSLRFRHFSRDPVLVNSQLPGGNGTAIA